VLTRWVVLAGGVLVLVAGLALSARDGGKPSGSVDATFVLTGGSCRSHAAACAKLADGGSVVIFGPVREGTADWPRHLIRLDGPTTSISIPLDPGLYSLAFFIEPPWATLLPDFGKSPAEGVFTVGKRAVHLGVVRPGKGWIVTGD
jgi:hypothetical protein